MSDLYLTYASIDAAAVDIATERDSLLTLLAEVKTEVDSLGSDFHTQTASGTYESTVATFVASMTDAVEGLERLSAFLTGTVDTFATLDSQLAGALTSGGSTVEGPA